MEITLTHEQHYQNLIERLHDLEADIGDIQLLRYISMAIRRAEMVRDNPEREQTPENVESQTRTRKRHDD